MFSEAVKLIAVKSTKDYDHYVTNTMVDHVYTYDPSKLTIDEVVESLSKVRGHVVEMPLEYLSEEKLITSELTKLTGNCVFHMILISANIYT
jgi:hypothetical protein